MGQDNQNEKGSARHPFVDFAECNLCGGCIEVCPLVFVLNEDMGIVEVVDLDHYPVADVDEAIKNCPLDCICWED